MSTTERRYCRCGASMAMRISPPRPREEAALLALWQRNHQGDGHGPTTARQAAQARRREEDRLNV